MWAQDVAQRPAGNWNCSRRRSHLGTIEDFKSGYACPSAGSPWYPAHTQRALPQTAFASHLRCSSVVHYGTQEYIDEIIISFVYILSQRRQVQRRLTPSLTLSRYYLYRHLCYYSPPLSASFRPHPFSSCGSRARNALSC